MIRVRYDNPGDGEGPVEGEGGFFALLVALFFMLYPTRVDPIPGQVTLEHTTYIRDLDLRHQSGGQTGSCEGPGGCELSR